MAVIETAAIATEQIALAIKTTAMIETSAKIRIVAALVETPKIIRKEAIIAVEKEIMTMAAKTSKRSSAASFNKREKYIKIYSDTTVLV